MSTSIADILQDRIDRRRARLITYSGALERTSRGALFLDHTRPRWYEAVDLDHVDVRNLPDSGLVDAPRIVCVGPFRWLLARFGRSPRVLFRPARLGFLPIPHVSRPLEEQDFEHLNQAWRQQVALRRAKGRKQRRPSYVPPPPRSADSKIRRTRAMLGRS